MYRTHNCGELRISDLGKQVTLSGWVQKSRDKGFMVWLDLRDRYGISQLIFDEERTSKEILKNPDWQCCLSGTCCKSCNNNFIK